MSRELITSDGLITVRPALPADAERLRGLRIEALADTPEAFAADYAAAVIEPVDAWVERIAKNNAQDTGVICVAEIADRLIGMMALSRGHWPKTRHGGMIWGVYVTPVWRGHRVAEALVDECVVWAQAYGVVVLKLGAVTTNTPAIRCYVRCGFTVYGVEPKVIHHDGVFYDELLMVRHI
jgi:RimJ/RimL family protein N-acetyltransferase